MTSRVVDATDCQGGNQEYCRLQQIQPAKAINAASDFRAQSRLYGTHGASQNHRRWSVPLPVPGGAGAEWPTALFDPLPHRRAR